MIRNPSNYTLKGIQDFATKMGGRCLSLSKKPIIFEAKLTWQCQKGHVWKASPVIVEQGVWCPQCVKDEIKKAELTRLKDIAQEKGGLCLSDKFINKTTKLNWQCKYGHTWETIPKLIINGHWCPICAGTNKLSLKDAKQLAIQKNGKCLSKVYENNRANLTWQCEKEHQWRASLHSVKDNETWCPVCAKNEAQSVDKILNNFLERGGKYLSNRKNITPNTSLLLQCPKGHVWKTKLRRYVNCPFCAKRTTRITIKDMQKLAAEKGGRCLSDKYINTNTKLKWQCRKGHEWFASPDKIKIGRWCPECIGRRKLTISEMHELAEKMGGRFIPGNYSFNQYTLSTKFKWQCKKGHIWESIAGRIKQGRWCPVCIANKRAEINDVQKLAAKKEGICLSEKYVNSYTKLKWQCKEGHVWETTPQTIRNGAWCPECGRKLQSHTIEQMQKLARARGGICLSTEYINKRTKLKWQCKEGHIWETLPLVIQRGGWCPECHRLSRKNARHLKLPEFIKNK